MALAPYNGVVPPHERSERSERRERPGVSVRDLAFALVAIGIGGLGAAIPPGIGPEGDGALAFLAWLALWAAPAGLACECVGLAGWPTALAVPGGWMVMIALRDASGGATLAHPAWTACILAGLFLVGFGIARAVSPFGPAGVALLLASGAVLAGVGQFFGLSGAAPWSPSVAARLVDLSPVSWVVESAGLDWMRHPAQYEPVGTASMGPDVRVAFRGALAGPVVLLVGCATSLAATAARRWRASAGQSSPDRPQD